MEVSKQVLTNLMNMHHSIGALRSTKAESIAEIASVHEPIQYDDFYSNYLALNLPVILGQWATADWHCRRLWLDVNGSIQLERLLELFGNATVPVANCTKDVSYSHPKQSMKFDEFISYMKDHSDTGQLLYLKDWHFKQDFPSYNAYTTPIYFESDWLNEFWDSRCDNQDDYRFLYFGPQGSWTPFHADVFRSFSWSANISGKKKWILCPAGSEEKLRDRNGHLPFDIDTATLERHGVKYYEVIQNSGEVLFVPSGWHHQVFNLEDTLSINHNWLNACNIDICWKYLNDSLSEVEKEINEHRETMENWTEHCQLFLRADIGMDFIDFLNLMHVVGERRLSVLHSQRQTWPPSKDGLIADDVSWNQAFYDVFRISEIVVQMMQQPKIVDVFEVGRERLSFSPVDFLNSLLSAVDHFSVFDSVCS